MPLTKVIADSGHRNNKVMYVTNESQKNQNGKRSLSKRKLEIYSRWHRLLAAIEIVSALVLLGMEIATTVMIPSAPDMSRSRRPLLITFAMVYAFSLLLPASLSIVIAYRRRKAMMTALIIICVLESIFSAGIVAVHVDFMTAPVEHGTVEANLLEAKFGLGVSLSCLIMLVTIGQTVLCCRETCQKRCNRTYDAYSGIDMVEVEVHHSQMKITNNFMSTPYSASNWDAFNSSKYQSTKVPNPEVYETKTVPSAPPMYQYTYRPAPPPPERKTRNADFLL